MARTCPVCKVLLPVATAAPYLPLGRVGAAPQRILFCPNCGLGVADPFIPEEVKEALYTRSGFWDGTVEDLDPRQHPLFVGLARARWDLIAAQLGDGDPGRPPALLDIGAGHGFLGLVAAGLGRISRYVVVEPEARFRAAIEAAWPHLGSRTSLAVHARLADVHETFGIAALSHVLEHVEDPLGLLAEVSSRLDDGGLVFVDVPHRDDRFKAMVFPHLFFFTAGSLFSLLRAAGLDILDLDAWGMDGVRSPIAVRPPLSVRLRSRTYEALKPFLPPGLSGRLSVGLYAANRRNPSGMWLRAVARKPSGSKGCGAPTRAAG